VAARMAMTTARPMSVNSIRFFMDETTPISVSGFLRAHAPQQRIKSLR